MRRSIFVLLFLITLNNVSVSQQYDVENPLKILEVKVSEKRFDLSGLCSDGEHWYVNADKPWNHFIYKVDTANNQILLEDKYKLDDDGRLDLEGIDYADNTFFFCDERQSRVLTYNKGETKQWELNWQNADPSRWGNAGFEGIAVDSQSNRIFLGKERDPQKIFKVSINGGEIRRILTDLTIENDFHISDMKYEKKHLFVLDRDNYRILKINLINQKIEGEFDYSQVLNHDEEKFYTNSQYPMAEALLLTPERLLIGLDNNGESFNEKNKWIRNAGLEGRNPVIIIFERPKQF